jgi:hypothetical protein
LYLLYFKCLNIWRLLDLHYFCNVVNLSMLNYVRTYIKYYNYTYCVYSTALEKRSFSLFSSFNVPFHMDAPMVYDQSVSRDWWHLNLRLYPFWSSITTQRPSICFNSGCTLIPKTQGKLTLCFSILIAALHWPKNKTTKKKPLRHLFLQGDVFGAIFFYIFVFVNLLCWVLQI